MLDQHEIAVAADLVAGIGDGAELDRADRGTARSRNIDAGIVAALFRLAIGGEERGRAPAMGDARPFGRRLAPPLCDFLLVGPAGVDRLGGGPRQPAFAGAAGGGKAIAGASADFFGAGAGSSSGMISPALPARPEAAARSAGGAAVLCRGAPGGARPPARAPPGMTSSLPISILYGGVRLLASMIACFETPYSRAR